MQAEIINPRWRLTNRKYLYINLYTSLLHNYNDYSHVFQVHDVDEAILYIVWYNFKLEIQDGGSQTGNTYISACIQHNCTIQKAIPMFSRSRNSIKLLLILYYASGNQKSKMVARKHEYFLLTSHHLEFLSSFCIIHYREQFYWIPGPWKYGYSRWNCVAKLYTSWDISISGLLAAILDCWRPLALYNMRNSSAEFLYLIKHWYSGWNCTSTLYTSWDMNVPGLWAAILDFLLPLA